MKEMDIFAVTLVILIAEFLFLSFRVIRWRWKERVVLKDGGSETLLRAIRAHGNFSEYVPLTLITLLVLAHYRMNVHVYLGFCVALIVARIIHAIGVSVMEMGKKPSLKGRQIGAGLTFLVLIVSAITILIKVMV